MERQDFLIDPDESFCSQRLAEVAGGTTAECAAVVCCFPCTVVHFIVLAMYKVPAGLYRKAVNKKRRRRLLKKGLLIKRPNDGTRVTINVAGERFVTKAMESDVDINIIEFEKEMWETFYGTGFFRSLSQRLIFNT